jgi:GT2 family glycosyltransferase/glycosyltransferase involved in cell wall biosynthesis
LTDVGRESDVETPRRVSHVAPGESVGVARGTPVVCIPVFGQHALFVRCLESVLARTPADVPILVADDASPDRESERYLEELALDGRVEHTVHYLRQERNLGFVGNVNAAFAVAAPGDVVLLNSDCEVGPEWVERLRAAAYSASNVATATALTNHGTILSVPGRNEPVSELPAGADVEALATAVAGSSRRLRPRIPTMIGHCSYVKRQALDLVGGFDPAFAPGYGEEVDFSQRCVLRGLVHVAADDVFVYHRGSASFGQSAIQEEHERLIADRYPYYHPAVAEVSATTVGPLAESLLVARQAFGELTVTVDARCLGDYVTGTQVHVLELIGALARTRRARLRALVVPHIGAGFRRALERMDGVELLVTTDVDADTPRTTIVHRPYQVFDRYDLQLVARLGERFVITHQDLISYRNPGYARSLLEWHDLQRLTRLTLAMADQVLFFSQDAADDALAEQLVDERRTRVAHLGIDHPAGTGTDEPRRPEALPAGADAAFLLCLGTNFRHKNRVFALRLLEALRRRHDWDGWLVLAGPHATRGGSEADEAAFLAEHPDVAARTVDLQSVGEAEKRWLLRSSKGVLYPSLYEGFGLIPFEAAHEGAPCFFAWQTSLRELLPAETARIVEWDPDSSADRIAPALAPGSPEAAELVRAVRAAGASLTWDRTAELVLDAYAHAVREPRPAAAMLASDVGSPADLALRASYRALDDLGLPDDVYRAFLAVASRPWLRGIFFTALRLVHRTGYLIRHRRLPRPGADPY